MSAATNKQVSATVTDGLPDDVISMILLKLPVNSLLRFCSLSKQWNSTITSSIFANQHINNMTLETTTSLASSTSCLIYAQIAQPSQIHRLIATRISTDGAVNTFKLAEKNNGLTDMINPPILSLYDIPIRSYFQVSSSNGLLFMSGIIYRCRDEVIIKRIMQVINPATRRYKDLAKVPIEFDQHKFDRYFILGFGYDPSTDDCKVVYSFKVHAKTRITLVLSMKTNTWRQVNTSTSPDLSECRPTQLITGNNATVAVSGNVYWIVFRGTASNPHQVMILQYSLANERFELIPFPERATKDDDSNHFIGNYEELIKVSRLTLSNHKGSLYVFVAHYNFFRSASYKTGEIDVWMLENKVDAGSIVIQKVGVIPSFEETMFQPLGFNCSGNIIMRKLKEFGNTRQMSIYAYIPKQKKYVELCQIESSWDVHLVQMETLTCP